MYFVLFRAVLPLCNEVPLHKPRTVCGSFATWIYAACL